MLQISKSVALAKVIDKIKSIDWTIGEFIDWTVGDQHLKSNSMLLMEHFHRLALWCDALQTWSYWPSVDMFRLFNLNIDDEIERDEIHTQLALDASHLGHQAWIDWDKWFRWLLVEEYATKAYPHLPDPFAPLIRMYERGGTYHTEHGFVYVGRLGYRLAQFPREKYLHESFVSSLDDATLNALDK